MDIQRTALGCQLVSDVARSFGEVRIKALGLSMIPVVWPGDILIVRYCDPTVLQPGEVIVYERESGLVAHRITAACDNTFLTHGDALPDCDLPVRHADIVGRVDSLIRRGCEKKLHPTFFQRVVAFIVSRSTFCLRVVLHFNRYLYRFIGREAAWTN